MKCIEISEQSKPKVTFKSSGHKIDGFINECPNSAKDKDRLLQTKSSSFRKRQKVAKLADVNFKLVNIKHKQGKHEKKKETLYKDEPVKHNSHIYARELHTLLVNHL